MTGSASYAFLMDNEPMPEVPDTQRKKSIQEQMQEIANANLVKVIADGFGRIDQTAAAAKRKLAEKGITGVDQIIDSFAGIVKRKSVELATGRKQAEE